MQLSDIETPALLIEQKILLRNIAAMQKAADAWKVALRPHTKTHKMPAIATMQIQAGAQGITVAKTQEAVTMAAHGIRDIFIANEIVSPAKLEHIRELSSKGVHISFGIDSLEALERIEHTFTSEHPARILIEVETGENRSGVIEEDYLVTLSKAIARCRHVDFRGVFSHEGHTYRAKDHAHCLDLFGKAQRLTLRFAAIAGQEIGWCPTVSIGATPSILIAALHEVPLERGITEIRPGTYIFMDASQGNAIGSHATCAATVLASVVSKPTAERTIADAGAKALTMQSRSEGICTTVGKGIVTGHPGTFVDAVYDEHTIILDRALHDSVAIGDTIRIIPNHICPAVNLYDQAYLVDGDTVVDILPISARGKIQ